MARRGIKGLFPTTVTLRVGEIVPEAANREPVFARNWPQRAICLFKAHIPVLRPLKFSATQGSRFLRFSLSTYQPGP